MSEGMGTEIGGKVITDEVVDKILNRDCWEHPVLERCEEFNNCIECLRDALRRYRSKSQREDGAVYVVSRLPYGSHGAPADGPAALVGVYGSLDGATYEVLSKSMNFVPIETSSEDGRIVFEYALDGDKSKALTGVNFPQYVVTRCELQ